MRWLLALSVIASALVLVAGAEAGSHAFKPRKCGQITIRKGGNDYTYGIKVFQAPLPCSTAQLTMSHFILGGVVPRRWFCRYGHSRDAWAATCARKSSTGPIVRAYLVAG
jgi:hypothetical protein